MSAALEVETGRVIMRGDWATEVIYDVAFSGTENIKEFDRLFEIVPGKHQAGTDYYQGLDFMSLIRRKSDGVLFGYPYWTPLARHVDVDDVGPNGVEHGFDSEEDDEIGVYVWLPVEMFVINGYRTVSGNADTNAEDAE